MIKEATIYDLIAWSSTDLAVADRLPGAGSSFVVMLEVSNKTSLVSSLF